MLNPLALVLKIQLDLLRQWCELTRSMFEFPARPVEPVRVRSNALVPPGHPTTRRRS